MKKGGGADAGGAPPFALLQSYSDSAVSLVVRQMAMLSQLAVFEDIIPGYRIRMLTDKEKNVRPCA
jgi:hypothetical protein